MALEGVFPACMGMTLLTTSSGNSTSEILQSVPFGQVLNNLYRIVSLRAVGKVDVNYGPLADKEQVRVHREEVYRVHSGLGYDKEASRDVIREGFIDQLDHRSVAPFANVLWFLKPGVVDRSAEMVNATNVERERLQVGQPDPGCLDKISWFRYELEKGMSASFLEEMIESSVVALKPSPPHLLTIVTVLS